jgi:hypothetical protein
MEDDAFGRCYVACMNRCADDCRRDPAICPGAREAAPRSATSSAPPSAGPPTSTWSRPTGNSPLPFFTSPTIRSFPQGGRRPYVESMRRRGAAISFRLSGGLNAAEAEEGTVGCAGAAMPAGGASGTEAVEEGGTTGLLQCEFSQDGSAYAWRGFPAAPGVTSTWAPGHRGLRTCRSWSRRGAPQKRLSRWAWALP